MLRFFRLNDPYRLIIIFFILLTCRLPYLFSEGHLTLPELDYMLVGEKVSNGATLYDGVWENIAPFSAAVYTALDYLFGRSQAAYYWVALIIVFFQSFLFNRLLLHNKAYNENTYVPGLIYGLLASFYFDFLTLTPVLMGLTFMLLALNNIFSHMEFRAKRDEKILNIGLYLGISCLFYLPYIVFGLAALVVFVFFTGTVLRRYLLLIFGFILPIALATVYFLISSRLSEFIYSFVNPLINLQSRNYMALADLWILFAFPVVLLLLSLVNVSQRARFTNYQARLTQGVFVWMIFAVGFVLLADQRSPNVYIIFVPIFAFFISHYLLLIRRRFLAEIALLLIVASVIFFNHGLRFGFFPGGDFHDTTTYLTKEGDPDLKGKKVLILDNHFGAYINCKPATPFLDWQMSHRLFEEVDYYDNMGIIYTGFENDFPEVILDPNNVLPKVFAHLPILEKRYTKNGQRYLLKN